ncbi:MAG TPA: hypothetical protein VFW11_23695 [Cyclobacteriaceae bacterium]|nr:hypothetical protein [Cyclobacteriaceae bacterium]
MKRTILLFLIVSILSVTGVVAQINQGTFLVGASSNLGFSSTSTEGSDNVNVFLLDLKGGYFVMDNLAVGLSLGYTKYSAGDFDGSSTTIGLFGRYYIHGKIFAGLGFSSTDSNNSDSYNSVPFEFGYAAFVTDNIALEPSLSYSIGVGDNESNTFGLNVGFTLYFNR